MNKNLDSKVETITRNGGTVGYETITPALATEYLNAMPGNRPLSNKQVEYLTQQAEAGKFFSNVAPLHFDTEGGSGMVSTGCGWLLSLADPRSSWSSGTPQKRRSMPWTSGSAGQVGMCWFWTATRMALYLLAHSSTSGCTNMASTLGTAGRSSTPRMLPA